MHNIFLEQKQTFIEPLTWDGFVDVESFDKLKGYDTILTPDKKMIYVPRGTKILGQIGMDKFSFQNWELGYGGTKETHSWLPIPLNNFFEKNSVFEFQTPDGKVFRGDFKCPKIEEIYRKQVSDVEKFREFYSLDPSPECWVFKGYYDIKTGQVYQSKEKPYQGVSGWIIRHWELLLQVAASITVAILTMGSSLLIQALAQLGVDLAFAVYQLTQGNSIGALMCVVMGLFPVIGRFAKFGVKAPMEFLRKYGKELSAINDADELVKFYNKLPTETDKLVFSRVWKQTPAELEKTANEGLINLGKKAIKDRDIVLEDIPLENRLWWKTNIIEPGAGLGAGLSVGSAAAHVQQKKSEKELLDLTKQTVFGKPHIFTQEEIQKSISAPSSIQGDE